MDTAGGNHIPGARNTTYKHALLPIGSPAREESVRAARATIAIVDLDMAHSPSRYAMHPNTEMEKATSHRTHNLSPILN